MRSPFPDAPRPTTPTTPPRLDPFDYFFGNRVVEEVLAVADFSCGKGRSST